MIAKTLKELRTAHHTTQSQLANIIGVSQQAVAQWENDKADPDNAILIKLADYFNVTIDYLVGRTNKNNTNELNLSITLDQIDIIKRLQSLDEAAQEIALDNIKNTLDNYQRLIMHISIDKETGVRNTKKR